jgi:diguanylate cyclase (GGDEF)-like protein/PAS domain S-box-containing protein
MVEDVSDSDNVHGTLIVDAGGVIRYCSATLVHIVRRRADELVGGAIRSVLPDYALPVTVAQEEAPSQAACAAETQPITLHLATAAGRSIPVNVLVCTLPCEPSSLLVLDVWPCGGKLAHQPELQRLAWSVERSSDAVIITDADAVIEYVNPAFEFISGFASAEAIGKTPAILKSGHHTQEFYRELWETLRSGAEFRGVLVNRKKSGELFYEEKVIRPFFDAPGRITHFVSIGRDSTDRIRAMERLTHAATHDSLTDLPNRQLFFDRLGQALRQATRRASGLAVAVIDADRFKQINDTLGHLTGDAVLKAIATRLARSVREADIVARLGGDEFGLVLLDVAETGTLAPVLAKIERAFERPVLVGERSIPVSISIGACLYPAAADNERDLMHRADELMYQAKRGGGGRYCIAPARDAAGQ